MVTPSFNKDHKDVLDLILLKLPKVKEGKMFGYPAYYIQGKLFACIMEGGVCLKIPEPIVQKLIKEKRAIAFKRMGRTMREWVQLDRKNSKDYIKDKVIFKESAEYVLSLIKKPIK
jgi:hypothetical protein